MKRNIGRTRLYPCWSLAACLGAWICWISPALAQVNGSGPSPSSSFDNVLNLPGDEAVITGNPFESIGGVPEQTTQLNVSDDGVVGRVFAALSGSEVNISGGSVGDDFRTFPGSEVNISRGFVGEGFRAFSGSEVNISGGSVGDGFDALLGSDVELIGGEFRLNGANFDGGSITSSDGDVFTGTLADGSAFIFSELSTDVLVDVTLTTVSLPPLDTNPIVVDAPVVGGPSGLRPGQELTVVTGGSLGENFAVVDAILNVDAGTVGIGLEASGSVVNINGGSVKDFFQAFSGSEVNISGGSVGERFVADNGIVNINGGAVDRFFRANGSEVNISGGFVDSFSANSGSEVNISGGSVGFFDANSGSEVNISGGSVGRGFDANSGSIVNINGGAVGIQFIARSDSEVNISGGSVGHSFGAGSGSEVNISGGSLGHSFGAGSGSEVNISGGSVGRGFDVYSGSDVELIGGEFRLNGANFDGGSISLSDGDVFTGTLADGSAFVFRHIIRLYSDSDTLVDVTLTPASLPPLDTTPIVVDAPIVGGPSGLRPGQQLTVVTDGSLGDNFAVVDAILNVDAGTVENGLEASGSVVNISGGL